MMPFLREKCPTVRGLFEDRSGFVREKPPFAEQTTSKPPTMSVQERIFCSFSSVTKKRLQNHQAKNSELPFSLFRMTLFAASLGFLE